MEERTCGNGPVIAFLGRSACGKDTLIDQLCSAHPEVHKVKLDTTRPQRPGESDDAYNFIKVFEFSHRATDGYYVCYAYYNGWFYGVPKNEIDNQPISAVALSPQLVKRGGMRNIKNMVPVYIRISPVTSLMRSVQREGRLTWEMIRRTFADSVEFFGFKRYLKKRVKQNGYKEVSSLDQMLTEVNEKYTASCGQT